MAAIVFFAAKEIASVSSLQALGLTGATIMAVYAWHINRRDLNFVSNYLQRPALQVAVNYNLLVLPVSAALAVNLNWPLVLALHAAVSALVLFRLKPKVPRLAFIGRFVPAEQFEWIAGIRSSFYSLLLLLPLALLLSPVKLFGVGALFLINTIVLSFYSHFEPLVMLNPKNLDAGAFLNRKMAFSVKVLLMLNVPLLAVNAAFHPEIAWFNLCLLGAFIVLAACSVQIKYANYHPNGQLGIHADFLVLFAMIFLPYLLPLGIFIYFSSRRKAIQHLLYYTDDHSETKQL